MGNKKTDPTADEDYDEDYDDEPQRPTRVTMKITDKMVRRRSWDLGNDRAPPSA